MKQLTCLKSKRMLEFGNDTKKFNNFISFTINLIQSGREIKVQKTTVIESQSFFLF